MAKAKSGRHRIFNGKQYFKYRIIASKREAQKLVKELRESGRHFVRLVAEDNPWAVYCLEKT